MEPAVVDEGTDTLTPEQQAEADKLKATEQEENAQFEEGFKQDTVEPTATPAPEKPDKPAEATAEPAKPAEPTPEPKYVQITEEQLAALQATAATVAEIKAAMGTQEGKVFGKIGGFERTLKELQEATPAGQTITLTEEDFEELKADFPDLAAMTVKGFNRALARIKGTAKPAAPATPEIVDPVKIQLDIDQRVSAQVDTVEKKTEMRLLSFKHRDWRKIVGITETGETVQTPYREWLAKQPPDYQKEVGDSWDSLTVGDSIDKFIEDSKKTPAPPTPADPRKARLKGAVPPKGSGGITPGKSEDDEFEEGFKEG